MKIPHSKPCIDVEDVIAVDKVVSSGMHATGKYVRKFENEICNLTGAKYAKATTSGTTALHLALLSLNIKEGDQVIIPSYVCQSLLNAVNYTKATPILADIDSDFEKGYNISAKTIKPLVKRRVKAIIIPHMFGYPAGLDEIIDLGIPVIEDCAQSLGAGYKRKKTGSMGDIGIFSFYATKVISTGQGGMIVTSSEKIKDQLEDLTKYDRREEYRIAHNYDMTNIQAALGSSQLEKLSTFIKMRKKIARKYNYAFQNLNFNFSQETNGSFPFRYVIQLNNKKKKDSLQKKLKKYDIIAEQPVFKPLHQYLNLPKESFPNTELAHDTCLSIPIYPSLKDDEVNYIIENVVNIMKK